MKLKYYMRGLGIGIVVTAILMSVFGKVQIQELTDSEIKEKAKAIGMIEDTVLADISEKNLEALEDDQNASEEDGKDTTKEVTPVDTKKDVTGDGKDTTKEVTPVDTKKDVTGDVKDTTKEVTPEDANKTAPPFIITVRGGDGSFSVSSRLAEAGLVESAAAYDNYLCINGYDKKITSGNHSIPPNATQEEIAKIITKSH